MSPRRSARDYVERLWPLLSLAVLVASVGAVTSFGSEVVKRTAIEALIKLIAVVGLYIFIGNSGIVSFGHIGFMAIGAYVSALLTLPASYKKMFLSEAPLFVQTVNISPLWAALVACAMAGVFAFLCGLPIVRLAGLSASIVTFAVLNIVYVVVNNWEAVTGGYRSLVKIPTYTSVGSATVCALLAITCAYVYQGSIAGLRLRAAREDEYAALAMGIRVYRERLIALVVSSVVMASSGVLYAHFIGSLSPTVFYLDMTFITLAMLVIGGKESLTGAVVGSFAVSAVAEILRVIEQWAGTGADQLPRLAGLRELGLAGLMLVVLLFRQDGIVGGAQMTWPFTPKFRAGRKLDR